MSTDDLVQQLVALPLPDRVTVAQALWESIDEDLGEGIADNEAQAIQAALRRDAELTAQAVAGRTHEDVMEAVRRALACG